MPQSTPSCDSSQSPNPTTEYAIDEATGGALIPLGGKKFAGWFTIVDLVDAPTVSQFKLSGIDTSRKNAALSQIYVACYALRQITGSQLLHRYLLGVTDRGVEVDHKNHNGLDNRRCNLRATSKQKNQFNRRPHHNAVSKFKGVWWKEKRGRWVAAATIEGKQRQLGYFAHEIDAARAYDDAVRNYHGEFAYLNFPDEEAA